MSQYVSQNLTEKLISNYCVDAELPLIKGINFNIPCITCIDEQKRLILRRFMENEFIESLEKEVYTGPYFLVDSVWAAKWSTFTSYMMDDIRVVNRFLYDQFPAPGPIENKNFSSKSKNEDYTYVNGEIMQALDLLYGCDIKIGRDSQSHTSKEVLYTASYVDKSSYSLILNSWKPSTD